MYKLTDALALYTALEKLDPSMTIERVNALVEAGPNEMISSLEGALDGLRRLVRVHPHWQLRPVMQVEVPHRASVTTPV